MSAVSTEAAQLRPILAAMIRENGAAQKKFDTATLGTINTLHAPGYWAAHDTIWICANCSTIDGGGDGDACAAVALVLVIAALVIALAVSVGVAYKHHEETNATRAQLQQIRTQERQVTCEEVRALYDEVMPMQRANLHDCKAKTLSSMIVSGGICLMTVAACIALFAVVTQSSVSFHAITFAVAGGEHYDPWLARSCSEKRGDCHPASARGEQASHHLQYVSCPRNPEFPLGLSKTTLIQDFSTVLEKLVSRT